MKNTLLTSLTLLLTFSACNKFTIAPNKEANLTPASVTTMLDQLNGPAPSDFTSEVNLPTLFESKIRGFYATGVSGTFLNPSDAHQNKIAYRLFENSPNAPGVVVLPGRGEALAKYAEVAYDLFNQGYSVYLISHRGQGESDHLVSNVVSDPKFQIGHIFSFMEPVQDLHYFLNTYVDPQNKKNLYLLAHSMGGAIGALYESTYPGRFKAIVLNSPMLEINTSPYGAAVSSTLAQTFCNAGNASGFSIGQAAYQANPSFNPVDSNADNQVTHSENRFNLKVKLVSENPAIQLGGVSNGWLCEWLVKGTAHVRTVGNTNQTPTLIFQAAADLIVMPGGQNTYCSSAAHCQLETYAGAYHEILQESDLIRNRAMSHLVKWFRRYP